MTSVTFLDLDALRSELRRDEGVRLKPYRDTVGKITIGVGRNLTDVGITPEEADLMLDHDIAVAIGGLSARLPWFTDLDPVRQRALVNLAFNIGVDGLLGFHRMLTALRLGVQTGEQQYYDRAAGEALNSSYAKQTKGRAIRVANMLRTGTV